MNTKLLTIIAVVIILAVASFFTLNSYIYNEKQPVAATDFKDVQFTLAGKAIQLKDGRAEYRATDDSAAQVITNYFGNEVVQDLNGDGRDDTAFIVTQNTGGSGTFYYVVGAIATDRGYVGTEAVLLGDRIAPQTSEKGPNRSIIINYAIRKAGESMTAVPSLGKSMRLLLDPETLQFGEVEQDFSGEADPARMMLGMKPWTWISAVYATGKQVTPATGKFVLTFSEGGTFSAATDCNSMNGSYTADRAKGTISFTSIASTLMYCTGSQEAEFSKILNNASTFRFTGRGELVLELAANSGSATFR